MNKKGIFMPTLALATMFLLTYAFFVFIIKDPSLSYYLNLGNNQVTLISTFKDAESQLFYNELAVKYSLYKTQEEFAGNGGVKSGCNTRWILNDESCNPALKENFEVILREKLKEYGLELLELKIEDNKAKIKLNDLTYSTNLANFQYKYSVKQILSYDLAIDFNKLDKIKAELNDCLKKAGKISTCASEKYDKIGNIIYFTIENNKNILSSASKGFKRLEVKFNVDENSLGVTKF